VKKLDRPFFIRLFVLILIAGVVYCIISDHEIPISDILVEGNQVQAFYWAPKTPHIRLNLDCNREERICSIHAYASYAPWYWFNPSGQREVAIPDYAKGYRIVIAWPDLPENR
jgi:hypothetical protein